MPDGQAGGGKVGRKVRVPRNTRMDEGLPYYRVRHTQQRTTTACVLDPRATVPGRASTTSCRSGRSPGRSIAVHDPSERRR